MEITTSTLFTMTQRSVSTPAQKEAVPPENRASSKTPRSGGVATGPGESARSEQQLRALQATDRAVRAHEQAHLAVAGHYSTSGANLEYRKGPDGRQYAVAGEVSIDTTPVPGDPQATLRKAEVIRRAALAPAYPSAQDRQVAAQASRMATEARRELQRDNSATGKVGSPLEQVVARSGADSTSERPAQIDLLA